MDYWESKRELNTESTAGKLHFIIFIFKYIQYTPEANFYFTKLAIKILKKDVVAIDK